MTLEEKTNNISREELNTTSIQELQIYLSQLKNEKYICVFHNRLYKTNCSNLKTNPQYFRLIGYAYNYKILSTKEVDGMKGQYYTFVIDG